MKMNMMTFTATFDKEIIESPSAGEYRVCDQYNNEKVFDFLVSAMVISDSHHDVTFDVWGLDEDVTDEDIAEALLSDNYKWEEFFIYTGGSEDSPNLIKVSDLTLFFSDKCESIKLCVKDSVMDDMFIRNAAEAVKEALENIHKDSKYNIAEEVDICFEDVESPNAPKTVEITAMYHSRHNSFPIKDVCVISEQYKEKVISAIQPILDEYGAGWSEL